MSRSTWERKIARDTYFDAPGRVLPSNSRARNRSRSRRGRSWKAPTRIAYILEQIESRLMDEMIERHQVRS